jgi:hypothetical protein
MKINEPVTILINLTYDQLQLLFLQGLPQYLQNLIELLSKG